MQEFDAQTRDFAAQIENELEAGNLNFPTSMDISLRIKRLADDPDSSIGDIVAAVRGEPVLSAKVLRMSNAMLLNPYGANITNLNDAVKRVGLAALRCLAFAVAAEQIIQDHRSTQLKLIASQLWKHSAETAAWAYAIALPRRTPSADTAMFAGMMVDIGEFYLLSRASAYPALESNLERFSHFVAAWRTPVSNSVLEAFELPEDIIEALDTEGFYSGGWPPTSLKDIIKIADHAVQTRNPFEALENPSPPQDTDDNQGIDAERFNKLLEETRAGRDAILHAISG